MSLETYISAERLDIYEKHLKVDTGQIIAAYHWNKALAGAMLPALQCLEVTLRNAIDTAVQSVPVPGATGLWLTDHNWIFSLPRYMGKKAFPKINKRYKMAKKLTDKQDAQGVMLDQYGHRIIARKVREEMLVDQARDTIADEGKTITPARIISQLSFGFWTTLLGTKYEDMNSKSLLWPNLEGAVFPHSPAGYAMPDIRKAFNRIRALRNRLSHHEALWKFNYDDPNTGLPDYNNPVYGAQASCSLLRKHYDDIIEMIGWMSPDRQKTFISHSANLRFYALCSVDGLNSYIAPEKVAAHIKVSRGGKGIKKLIKTLERNEFVRIVKDGQTIMTIGTDNSIFIP
ncbi:Abi family protein [Pantoea agglomerans]|uniref:Abi family protein n=1 Tax=Pantoea TaxID=53335 RepID=UPI00320B460F